MPASACIAPRCSTAGARSSAPRAGAERDAAALQAAAAAGRRDGARRGARDASLRALDGCRHAATARGTRRVRLPLRARSRRLFSPSISRRNGTVMRRCAASDARSSRSSKRVSVARSRPTPPQQPIERRFVQHQAAPLRALRAARRAAPSSSSGASARARIAPGANAGRATPSANCIRRCRAPHTARALPGCARAIVEIEQRHFVLAHRRRSLPGHPARPAHAVEGLAAHRADARPRRFSGRYAARASRRFARRRRRRAADASCRRPRARRGTPSRRPCAFGAARATCASAPAGAPTKVSRRWSGG